MSMTRARQAAVAVAIFRAGYGVALAAAPARTALNWLGSDSGRPATVVALRCLGAREIVLHGGLAAAALSGGSVRPWLLASMGGDCSDIVASFASGSDLPDGAAFKTFLVAGGSAALSAAVLAALGDE
jgi:hypothetical protein